MDMLIKLYQTTAFDEAAISTECNVPIPRKPIGPDHDLVTHWIDARFGPGWASEAQVALSNRPVTL